GEREEALEHLRQREIAPELLVGERVAALAEALGIERDIPRLEPPPRVLGQLGEVALGIGLAAPREVAQERDDLVRGARHLRRERELGVVAKAEEPRRLLPERQDLGDQRPVVPLSGR